MRKRPGQILARALLFHKALIFNAEALAINVHTMFQAGCIRLSN